MIPFQSTLPRRERQRYYNKGVRVSVVSIHAPTQGATVLRYSAKWLTQFQSTLPRRERLLSGCSISFSDGFNPRSHAGSDRVTVCIFYNQIGFQSTLPRRERRSPSPAARDQASVSIHAPTQGATHSVSIPAPTQGATAW